jgi:hypothetical protein
MFHHPEIMISLASQHRADLIAEARLASLARTARRARAAARTARRAATGRAHTDIDPPKRSAVAGSLASCVGRVAEPAP